eukprot:4651824-Pleurochrysis_carterae.AAC.1
MKTRSPGLGRAGAGKLRRVHCECGAGRAALTLTSTLGGGHEVEAVAATGVAADVVGIEAESCADAARASWPKCASEPTATLGNIERHGGVEACGVRGRDCHRSRTARALQPSSKPKAKGVTTVACGLRRAQAVKEQGCEEVVGLKRRERVGVVSREEGNPLTHTCLSGKGQLEVS